MKMACKSRMRNGFMEVVTKKVIRSKFEENNVEPPTGKDIEIFFQVIGEVYNKKRVDLHRYFESPRNKILVGLLVEFSGEIENYYRSKGREDCIKRFQEIISDLEINKHS